MLATHQNITRFEEAFGRRVARPDEMLENLLHFIENPTHPDDSFVRLDSVQFRDRDATLDVSVMDYGGVEVWARWKIRARALREVSIGQSGGDLSLLQRNHVLIRQHTDSRKDLYFRGVPKSALGTVGRLWVTHREVVSDWIPFQRYLNSGVDLETLLAVGYGMIADGPSFLIDAYARVLSDAGVNPNALGPRPARWWNGQQWTDEEAMLVGLVIGDSFLVAEEFEETEVARQ